MYTTQDLACSFRMKAKKLMKQSQSVSRFMDALEFAAYRHRFDKTKNDEPYINHIISVCRLIVVNGEENDEDVLMAAALHDTVEKTGTKASEINSHFGEKVFQLVMEVTDHSASNETEKFQQQLQRAGTLSDKAKLIKLADKIANVKMMLSYPPEGWDLEKRSLYINWADRIIFALRGTNEKLEALYDELVEEGRKNNTYLPDHVHEG
jgi:GTP diphosphokinase / guanosine-3',5'-bis(diphosphate) 3'-diphosphatase